MRLTMSVLNKNTTSIIMYMTCTVQLTARPQFAGCHRTSIAVVAPTCPSTQHIKAKWTSIRVCNWRYWDRTHYISCPLYCNLIARGIHNIQHICPVRSSHNTAEGSTTCPRNAHDGDNINRLSWLNTQVTTYIHVPDTEELIRIIRRWLVDTLKNGWTWRWKYIYTK